MLWPQPQSELGTKRLQEREFSGNFSTAVRLKIGKKGVLDKYFNIGPLFTRCGRRITAQLLIAAMLVSSFAIGWCYGLRLQHISALLFTSRLQCGTGET